MRMVRTMVRMIGGRTSAHHGQLTVAILIGHSVGVVVRMFMPGNGSGGVGRCVCGAGCRIPVKFCSEGGNAMGVCATHR